MQPSHEYHVLNHLAYLSDRKYFCTIISSLIVACCTCLIVLSLGVLPTIMIINLIAVISFLHFLKADLEDSQILQRVENGRALKISFVPKSRYIKLPTICIAAVVGILALCLISLMKAIAITITALVLIYTILLMNTFIENKLTNHLKKFKMDKIRNEGPPIKTKLPNFAQINTSQISRLKQRLNSIRKEKSLATILIVIGIATTINIIGLDIALAIIAVASIASCALLAEKI